VAGSLRRTTAGADRLSPWPILETVETPSAARGGWPRHRGLALDPPSRLPRARRFRLAVALLPPATGIQS
jgi:hypothetical protein